MTRRALLLAAAAGPLAAAPGNRLAVCSETFAGMSFEEACRAAHRTGYAAIEVEPAHLGPDPAALGAAERRRFRAMMREAGIAFAGLHSLLKTPAGLHLTTPDAAVRQKSWDYFGRLIGLAADLAGPGERPVMVLGSSRQREAIAGATPAEAAARLTEGLGQLAPAAERAGVVILMEPLAPHLCKVVTTMAEAMEIVRAVNSPAVQTILDTHNTASEREPLDALIRRYLPAIRHVHLNEMDGKRPGAGNFPFGELFESLNRHGYRGWLSVEVFDFKPDGETVARQAAEYLKPLAAPARRAALPFPTGVFS